VKASSNSDGDMIGSDALPGGPAAAVEGLQRTPRRPHGVHGLKPTEGPMESSVARMSDAWTFRRVARLAAVLIGLAVGVYIVLRYVPRFFVVTEASYGSYFWPRVGWVLPHVALSLLAITIGPLQLWSRIREHHWRFHRLAGRVYLAGVAAGSVSAIGLSLTAGFTPAYRVGLFFLALAWMGTTGMAFAAIRRRRITQHREWMIRSYVVTFAFVTFRVARDIVVANGLGTFAEMQVVMAWASWAVPLLITEMMLQGRAIFSKTAATR
jgi:uncharacterized membrane protein